MGKRVRGGEERITNYCRSGLSRRVWLTSSKKPEADKSKNWTLQGQGGIWEKKRFEKYSVGSVDCFLFSSHLARVQKRVHAYDHPFPEAGKSSKVDSRWGGLSVAWSVVRSAGQLVSEVDRSVG